MPTEKKPLSAQEVFRLGSQKLAEGDHAGATEHFQAILASGYTSAELESELGRALTEQGRLGEGVIHLSRAVALNRWNRSYQNDLNLAQLKVSGQMGVRMSHPAEWGVSIGTFVRPQESFFLAAASLLALLSIGLLRLKLARKTLLVSLLSLITVLSISLGGLGLYARDVGTVIQEAELKSSPLGSANTVQTLPSGTRLRIIRSSGDYFEVERTGAFRGWIESSRVEKNPMP